MYLASSQASSLKGKDLELCEINSSHIKMSTAADDLDDGLVYDMESYEGADAAETEDFDQGLESGDEARDEVNAKPKSEGAKPKEIGRKRPATSSKFQEKKKMKMQIDVDRKKGISTESSVDAIADYINEQLRRKNSDLSALELAELYFKKTDFRSTSEFTEPRTLENLSKYITGRFKNMLPTSTPGKKNTNKDKKKDKKNKNKNKKDLSNATETLQQPEGERKFIAILSMSALRACDVHRALNDIPGSSLKLINKNKIDIDLKLVKSTWSRVLCCTPGRLQKVLETEDLPLKREEIKIVIVDNSHLDQKMQNVFNINETSSCLKELTSSGAKIYMF